MMNTPYTKTSTVEFWTDEYISKKLLETHLDPHTDLASRKPETIVKTTEFIESFLPKNKTICDFGCGPGLYTDLLQQKGYETYGIDVSSVSLEYASKQNKAVHYEKHNYVERPLERTVDFVQMIYCDFGALTPYAQSHTLRNIKESLNDGGLFFFDVMSEEYFNSVEEEYITYLETDGFYTKGEAKIISKTKKFPRLKLVMRHVSVESENGEKEFYFYDKAYDINEMKILLEDNGFCVLDVYSNTMGSKEFTGSQTLCFLCKVTK